MAFHFLHAQINLSLQSQLPCSSEAGSMSREPCTAHACSAASIRQSLGTPLKSPCRGTECGEEQDFPHCLKRSSRKVFPGGLCAQWELSFLEADVLAGLRLFPNR